MNLPRLWRTVRPLRAEQTFGRAWHEARFFAFRHIPQLLRWRVERPEAPPELVVTLPPPVDDPEARARAVAGHAQGRLRLAGRDVAPDEWTNQDLPKLVRYHLQYLEVARAWVDAAALGAPEKMREDALSLVQRWATMHPPAGTEAWEPFPVSARLLQLSVIAGRLGAASPVWLRALLPVHARYVAAFPERHLQANHLLKNWAALSAAGLLLAGEEAEGWEAEGLCRLHEELDEQLLADGGHYERSPMYHLLVLGDLLDVRDLARARGRTVGWLDSAAQRMAGFLAAVLHPDGDLPLFNDTVLGQAPLPAAVFARLGAVPPSPGRIFDAPQTGLFVLRPERDEALIFDAGPLGPPHQPGHAHSDTLSFELSLGGERRAVNGGFDGYQSPHRAFYRSAVAHNTVTVGGEGPDELWSGFRVGGRSQLRGRHAQDAFAFLSVRASLAAFQGWEHERVALLFPRRALVVLDWVEAPEESTVVSRVRLIPGATPLRFVALAGEAAERPTAYAPELGRVFEATEHSVQVRGTRVRLGYALLWGAQGARVREGNQGLEVEVDGQSFRVSGA